MVKHAKERKFECYGKTVVVSQNFDAFNDVRKRYIAEANNAFELYRKKVDAYGSIEALISQGYSDAVVILKDIIQKNIVDSAINDYKIYDIDRERFYREYCGHIDKYLNEIFKEAENKAIEIQAAYEQNKAYREARKENAKGWVGGGFGVGGAIEGAVKAGAMNAATGAAHSVFNFFGNTADWLSKSSKLSDLYGKFNTEVCRSMYSSVYTLCFVNWNFLSDRGHVSKSDPYLKDREYFDAKVVSFLNNLSMIRDDNAVFTQVPQMLLYNPYKEELYVALYTRYGDPNGGLSKIAKYFGVDVLEKKKKELLESKYQELSDEFNASEERAKNAKEIFVKFCEQIGCAGEEKERLDSINKIIDDYDIKARSVSLSPTTQAVLCDTREEAAVCREKLKAIKTELSNLDCKVSETDAKRAKALLSAEAETSKVIKECVKDLLSEIENLVVAHDDKARTIVGIHDNVTLVCDSRDEVPECKEELIRIKNLLNDLNYTCNAHEASIAIARLKKNSADFSKTKAYEHSISELEKLAHDLDIMARTVQCCEKDILLDNETDAALARNDIAELDKLYQSFMQSPRQYRELNKLLQKKSLSSSVKTAYSEYISEFIEKQNKILLKSAKAVSMGYMLTYISVLVILIILHLSWNQVEWWGWKGIAFFAMITILFFGTMGEPTADSENSKLPEDKKFSLDKKYVTGDSWAVVVLLILPAIDLLRTAGWKNLKWFGGKSIICMLLLFAFLYVTAIFSDYTELRRSYKYLAVYATENGEVSSKIKKFGLNIIAMLAKIFAVLIILVAISACVSKPLPESCGNYLSYLENLKIKFLHVR